jgi:hypothetical protein
MASVVHSSDEIVRPWANEGQIVTGIVTAGSEHIGSFDQQSLTFSGSLSRFISDRFDFRFEALIGGLEGGIFSSRSYLAGAGFSFWPEQELSITPFLRIGRETFNPSGQYANFYGADILIERSINVTGDASTPFYLEKYVIPNVRLGSYYRDILNSSGNHVTTTEVTSLFSSVSYDFPMLMGRETALGRIRGSV